MYKISYVRTATGWHWFVHDAFGNPVARSCNGFTQKSAAQEAFGKLANGFASGNVVSGGGR